MRVSSSTSNKGGLELISDNWLSAQTSTLLSSCQPIGRLGGTIAVDHSVLGSQRDPKAGVELGVGPFCKMAKLLNCFISYTIW